MAKDIGLWSVGAQDWLAGIPLQIAVRYATRLHIEQGGRKAFVSEGNHETTVTQGRFHLIAEGSIVVQSQASDVSLKASGASVMLTHGGHAGIRASGSAVYQAQVHTAQAGAVKVQGGSSAQRPEALTKQAMTSRNTGLTFHAHDATSGSALNQHRYVILKEDGTRIEGLTDSQGLTQQVNAADVQRTTIHIAEYPADMENIAGATLHS